VREAGVYCELYPSDISPEAIETFAPRGIILSGGPESVTFSETPRPPKSIFDMDVPILGICYGMNVLVAEFGGSVDASARREFGHAQVRVNGSSRLLDNLQDGECNGGVRTLDVWMSHGDRVEVVPPSVVVIRYGPPKISSKILSSQYALRSVMVKSYSVCRVASTHLWWQRSYTAQLVISSLAYSWTMVSYAWAKRIR
jgi:GMP synthase (glutamine-hydrolysing) A subunit